MNGVQVAGRTVLQGAYSQLELDVTRLVRDGPNAIALRVFPNDSSNAGYLTLSMVDWNPPSPDGFTGLQFAPQLAQDGAVSLRDAHVVQHDARDLASRCADGQGRPSQQHRDAAGRRARRLDQPRRHRDPVHQDRADRAARDGARGDRPARVPALRHRHPALWWPYQMGAQPLYHLALEAQVAGVASDSFAEDFGIRTVTSRLTPVVPGDLRRARLPPVRDQRPAVRGARRRLVAGHVPSLLVRQHRRPARRTSGIWV